MKQSRKKELKKLGKPSQHCCGTVIELPNKNTMIAIKRSTAKRLRQLRKGEVITYDKVINRLIDTICGSAKASPLHWYKRLFRKL